MKDFVKIGIKAAKEAGHLLKEKLGTIGEIIVKDDHSLVTNLDYRAEKTIVDIIKAEFPDHTILAEESSHPTRSKEFTWIIDPLDGTHNYIRGIPLWGVSIGLAYKEEFVCGVIYLPIENHLYYAEKGSGAFKNDVPLKVSQKANLKQCTLSYDSGLRLDSEVKMGILQSLAAKVFNVRMFGASTTILTFLAEGTIDLAVEFSDKPWDFAAGALLITEAGGKFTDFKGQPASMTTLGYVGSNGLVHQQIFEIIRKFGI